MGNWLNKIFTRTRRGSCTDGERTLKDAPIGEHVAIKCLRGERAICQRLREMGFKEASVVHKLADNGALICKTCGTRVVISKKLAQNIIVHEAGTQDHTNCECKTVLLSEMTVGQIGFIHDFIAESDDCERIEEMGITPGERVEIIRYAPLGDPIEIKIRGYLLSLRKQEAELIEVKMEG